jgi:hypothetical protein
VQDAAHLLRRQPDRWAAIVTQKKTVAVAVTVDATFDLAQKRWAGGWGVVLLADVRILGS